MKRNHPLFPLCVRLLKRLEVRNILHTFFDPMSSLRPTVFVCELTFHWSHVLDSRFRAQKQVSHDGEGVLVLPKQLSFPTSLSNVCILLVFYDKSRDKTK